jgi:hypothetical protein
MTIVPEAVTLLRRASIGTSPLISQTTGYLGCAVLAWLFCFALRVALYPCSSVVESGLVDS